MKSYAVRITDHALNDMQDLYDYISDTLFAPEAAMNQYNRIADAIESLCEYPERYRLFVSEPEHTQGIRLLPIGHYAVIYTVRGDVVTALRVLYSASDIITRLRNGE